MELVACKHCARNRCSDRSLSDRSVYCSMFIKKREKKEERGMEVITVIGLHREIQSAKDDVFGAIMSLRKNSPGIKTKSQIIADARKDGRLSVKILIEKYDDLKLKLESLSSLEITTIKDSALEHIENLLEEFKVI